MRLFLFLILFPATSFSAQSLLNASYRSYPFGGNIDAQIRHEKLLWGDVQDQWRYGYLQYKVGVAAQGMFEAGISFFPISFLEFSASQSTTRRWSESKTMDCESHLCLGNVERSKVGTRFGFGYKELRGILSLTWNWVEMNDSTKPMYDEIEYIALNPGGEKLVTPSAVVGIQRESGYYGLLYRETSAEISKNKNKMTAFVYRQKEFGFAWNLGVGSYESSLNDASFTAFAALTWNWGNGIGLF